MPALRKAVKAELESIAERQEEGLWEEVDNYVLLTNVVLSGTGREEISALLTDGLPESRITIADGSDVGAMLDDSPRVRLSFPEVLGLRDLSALIDQAVRKDLLLRSSLTIEIAQELAPSFMATKAYSRALEVLARRGFVVLSGPPEMGKTSIARMIALARLAEGWAVHECREPGELFGLHDAEVPQVFVADDAFGSTEYRPDRGQAWGDDLERVIRLLDERHWLLLTSRPAPLGSALEHLSLQGAAGDFPTPQEVIVDAAALTVPEKAQMLYRHAKARIDEEEGREMIRASARQIVHHRHFTPLRIARLVGEAVPEILAAPAEERAELIAAAVTDGLSEPSEGMRKSFRLLPGECKTLLRAMLDCPGGTIELDVLEAAFARHSSGPPRRSAASVAELIDSHFIRIGEIASAFRGDATMVTWVHPSVRDLVIEELMSDGEARRAFLTASGLDGALLALSSGGGAAGERSLPLLREEADWDGVRACLVRLAEGEDPLRLGRLLVLLADLAQRAAQSGEAEAARLRETADRGLEALRERWTRDGGPGSAKDLETFFEATRETLPPMSGPDIRGLWNRLLGDLRDSIAGAGIEPPLYSGAAWLALAAVMAAEEPRWLGALDFPSSNAQELAAIVGWIEAATLTLSGAPRLGEDEEADPDEEIPPLDWTDLGVETLKVIAELDEGAHERCHKLAKRLETRAKRWQAYAAQQNYEREPDYDYEGRGGGRDGGFDLEALFTDL